MQSLFCFHEILEVAINGVPELTNSANNAQRITHKETKKKDCKVAFCIQSAVDTTDFE